jgi:hypothetical protein
MAPVKIGRGGEVVELRGAKAKLTGRFGGAEWYWSNGSTASSKLQWQWRAAVVFWASGEGASKRVRGTGRGGLVVLLRAQDRALRLCAARATAAARWRPRETGEQTGGRR